MSWKRRRAPGIRPSRDRLGRHDLPVRVRAWCTIGHVHLSQIYIAVLPVETCPGSLIVHAAGTVALLRLQATTHSGVVSRQSSDGVHDLNPAQSAFCNSSSRVAHRRVGRRADDLVPVLRREVRRLEIVGLERDRAAAAPLGFFLGCHEQRPSCALASKRLTHPEKLYPRVAAPREAVETREQCPVVIAQEARTANGRRGNRSLGS